MLNELKRPTLDISLDVDIPEIAPLEHQLGIVEEFVKELDKFYDQAIIEAGDSVDVKLVKAERTKVRKVLKTIEDNRKNAVKAFKNPIQDFEDTSKRIEKILKGTDSKLKEIVDADKEANADPFEGLSINSSVHQIVFECDDDTFKDIINYIEKKGIKVNGN